ncbi:MAG: TonB-dependent receptor [Bryobacteraceae bacterium]|nr:TonB-dependent receptor [Bryobacteraceae bacterium]
MTRFRLHLLLLGTLAAAAASAQNSGTLKGTVVLDGKGSPIHHASVLIVQLGRTAETADDGSFEFRNVPSGRYDVLAHMHQLTDARQQVSIEPGAVITADFSLRLEPVRQELTVTASGREETSLESFQTVRSLQPTELTTRGAAPSLGEYLENETGITKRSYGPGSSRPVIRGFDGDRVLVLQDGIRTGTLSSQSGDHGEPIDASTVERVEVVRGPATLMYGSNAIGGVVNAVTGHHLLHQHPHSGVRGSLNTVFGSGNGQAGGSGSFEIGRGNWILWANGGGQRTGDYRTPIGDVDNSATELKHTTAGLGRYGELASFNFSYGIQDGLYGVPLGVESLLEEKEELRSRPPVRPLGNVLRPLGGQEGEEVSLGFRRHVFRFNGALKNLGSAFEQFHLALNYSDWNHRELEGTEIGTRFSNKIFSYRGTFTQKKRGALSGSFGFEGFRRDYEATGEEALAPPTSQNMFALYGYEELGFERLRFQFGGRFEHNGYDAQGLRQRSFNGVSGSAGVHVPLWQGGAFVTNFTTSYRAPALEELYNNGPHPGNVTFEIGNPNLVRERSNGLDVSVRHAGSRVRAEASYFYYRLNDFVFLAPTGEFDEGLPIADYLQGNTRYTGAEARLDLGLTRSLWLNLGFDAVDAVLTRNSQALPRIPPVRGRAGIDYRWKGLSVRPELVLADRQGDVYFNERSTAGYGLVNLHSSYTWATQHFLHSFGVNVFNAGDRLYRNHLSLIKEVAPEIGRGVRFSYNLQWF